MSVTLYKSSSGCPRRCPSKLQSEATSRSEEVREGSGREKEKEGSTKRGKCWVRRREARERRNLT